MGWLKGVRFGRKAQGLVEYAVLVAIIVAIIVLAATPLKGAINAAFRRAATQINAAS